MINVLLSFLHKVLGAFLFCTSSAYTFYFGDKNDQLMLNNQATYAALKHNPFTLTRLAYVANHMNLNRLILLHQVHGILGYSVESNLLSQDNFEIDGDYIITNTPGVGIAVLTADCMPVICYAPDVQAIGIAHAGWRGLVDGVIPRMVDHMVRIYGTSSRSLTFFLGSFSQSCCYEVQQSFIDNFKEHYVLALRDIYVRDNRFFFDMKSHMIAQLRLYGLQDSQLNEAYARCTICSSSHYSYRKMGEKAGRNITIATLRDSYV